MKHYYRRPFEEIIAEGEKIYNDETIKDNCERLSGLMTELECDWGVPLLECMVSAYLEKGPEYVEAWNTYTKITEMRDDFFLDLNRGEHMRVRVSDWKRDWIKENGETDEFEVIIMNLEDKEIYAGSFRGIPTDLEDHQVIENARIIDSSDPKRIGVYTLKI